MRNIDAQNKTKHKYYEKDMNNGFGVVRASDRTQT